VSRRLLRRVILPPERAALRAAVRDLEAQDARWHRPLMAADIMGGLVAAFGLAVAERGRVVLGLAVAAAGIALVAAVALICHVARRPLARRVDDLLGSR